MKLPSGFSWRQNRKCTSSLAATRTCARQTSYRYMKRCKIIEFGLRKQGILPARAEGCTRQNIFTIHDLSTWQVSHAPQTFRTAHLYQKRDPSFRSRKRVRKTSESSKLKVWSSRNFIKSQIIEVLNIESLMLGEKWKTTFAEQYSFYSQTSASSKISARYRLLPQRKILSDV